jgi:hypothetical protein
MEQDSRTEKYQQMRELLNEKQWRQFLALEAKERGSIVLVAREAGVSKNTIKAGRREIEAGERFAPGKRIRGAGGGRKKQEEHDPGLQTDLEALLDPKGDPMRRVEMDDEKCSQVEGSPRGPGASVG